MEKLDKIGIDSNFGLIKCFNLVISFEGKLTNIGFWIFLALVIIHIPSLFCYFNNGIQKISNYLINEMKKYGYIKNKIENKDISNNNLNYNILNPPKNNRGLNNLKENSKHKKNKNIRLIDNSSFNNVKSSGKENIINLNLLNKNKDKEENKEIDTKIKNNNKEYIKDIDKKKIIIKKRIRKKEIIK